MEKIELNRTLISLGSNLGNKEANLQQAIQTIQELIGDIEFTSSFYESAPWGYDSENQFLNACITCYTHLSSFELLDQLKQIENSMGRIKTVSGYEVWTEEPLCHRPSQTADQYENRISKLNALKLWLVNPATTHR